MSCTPRTARSALSGGLAGMRFSPPHVRSRGGQAGGASVAASACRRAAAAAAATPASFGAPRHAGPTIRWKVTSRL
eukprot:1420861-Pleurochrysis_carterae.AAC.2